jgi:hypothetical protein
MANIVLTRSEEPDFSPSWPPSGSLVVARMQCGALVTSRYGQEFQGALLDCDGGWVQGNYLGHRPMTEDEIEAWADAVNDAPMKIVLTARERPIREIKEKFVNRVFNALFPVKS